jgi:hypothetical protein
MEVVTVCDHLGFLRLSQLKREIPWNSRKLGAALAAQQRGPTWTQCDSPMNQQLTLCRRHSWLPIRAAIRQNLRTPRRIAVARMSITTRIKPKRVLTADERGWARIRENAREPEENWPRKSAKYTKKHTGTEIQFPFCVFCVFCGHSSVAPPPRRLSQSAFIRVIRGQILFSGLRARSQRWSLPGYPRFNLPRFCFGPIRDIENLRGVQKLRWRINLRFSDLGFGPLLAIGHWALSCREVRVVNERTRDARDVHGAASGNGRIPWNGKELHVRCTTEKKG